MNDDFLVKLNKKFLKEAEEYAKKKKPMKDLFDQYRSYFTEEYSKKEIKFTSLESSNEDLELTSHQIQSSDDESMYEKTKVISFKNSKRKNEDHTCGNTEIYKFLTNYFDYTCPAFKPTYKKKKVTPPVVIVEDKNKKDDFEWPFLEPPKKPRTVFDSGPTREEIGEYNRRIFAAYTEYLHFEDHLIYYEHNPDFVDDDADEVFCETHKEHLFKSEIESFLYNGTDYIFQDKTSIIRVSKNEEGQKVFSLQGRKLKIEVPVESCKLYYIKNDGKVDLLNMEDLKITRLLFSDEKQSRMFYENFDVPCEY